MDKLIARKLRTDVEKALATVAQKHGMESVKGGNISWDEAELNIKVTFIMNSKKKADEDGKMANIYMKQYGYEFVVGDMVQLKKGAPVRSSKASQKVVDCTNRGSLIVLENGKKYRVSPDVVQYLEKVGAKPSPLPTGKITDAVWDQFHNLASQLSPENLTCDGELPKYEVKRRHSELTRTWKALERKVGRKVTEEEVWDRVLARSK